MTESTTYVVTAPAGTSALLDGRTQTPINTVLTGGSLTQALDGGGNALTNFDNGHTTADVALGTDASATVLVVTLAGLAASGEYLAKLGLTVWIYTDANHAIGGPVDVVLGLAITTDGAGMAACTLSGTPIPDVSNLPTGVAGASATVAASTGGFTISATRPAGTACHAGVQWWVNSFRNVT